MLPVRNANAHGSLNALLLAFALAGMALLVPTPVSGHAPSNMELSYGFDSQVLSVTITHNTPTPSSHFVETVEVKKNSVPVLTETYTDQPSATSFTYEYELPGADGDLFEVTATCNLFGSLTENVTVVGPKDRMKMTVTPDPSSVEMGTETEFICNIYRVDDEMPVDGVTLTVRADLGDVSEVTELSMGGYQFTYTALEQENEDVEVLNITASKNGYHTLYREMDFDVLFPGTQRKPVQITITPTLYEIDEGEAQYLTVRTRSEGQDLDVTDIDVDWSFGKLVKERTGKGQFRLTYTPDTVSADTTAYLKVKAEMEGYLPGEKSIEFIIKDLGGSDDDSQNGDGNGGNAPLVAGMIILVIIVVGAALYLIWRKKKS